METTIAEKETRGITKSRYPGIFKYPGSNNWTIRYYKNGARKEEPTGSSVLQVALELRTKRLGEVQKGTHVDSKRLKISIDTLYADWLATKEGLPSHDGDRQRWTRNDGTAGRLKEYFGGRVAISITGVDLEKYAQWCRKQHTIANGTINRDLAALSGAYSRAINKRLLPSDACPVFWGKEGVKQKESAPRKGFVKQPQYLALMARISQVWMRAIVAVAYAFGLRKEELLSLKVHQVDLLERLIRLDDTKNGERRWAPMTDEVYGYMVQMVAGKQGDDPLFTREDGSPVISFRERWETLAKGMAVGDADLLFHDLRRSALRNMIRRGIPRDVAMRISGHESPEVFGRYNIIDDEDLQDAGRKIQEGAARDEAKWTAQQQLAGGVVTGGVQ